MFPYIQIPSFVFSQNFLEKNILKKEYCNSMRIKYCDNLLTLLNPPSATQLGNFA